MGLRFRKSLRILPGLRLNLSKRGLSATLGRRGASLNLGRRGPVANIGIPGTGLSYRKKLGGGGPPTDAAGAPRSSILGCGCLIAVALLAFGLLAWCGDSIDNPGKPAGAARAAEDTATTRAQEFYLHGPMNLRGGPATSFGVLRTLQKGEKVQLGLKDASGWAVLYLSGVAAGYLYRGSDLVKSWPPGTQPGSQMQRAVPGRTSTSGYNLGPQGGCYTYSASGRKRYVDRSLCR